MHSLRLVIFTIAYLLSGLALALPHALDGVNVLGGPTIKAARSTNTCADPSLAHTVFQGANPAQTAHNLNYLGVFEDVNSITASTLWGDLHPAFKAWPTQQSFTFPLFQLAPANSEEYIYELGANAATPPIVSGFNNQGIIAWMYSSQVCGSVPLMSALLSSTSDTYYTIDPFVHDYLISVGWTDTGVVAFVLPLNDS